MVDVVLSLVCLPSRTCALAADSAAHAQLRHLLGAPSCANRFSEARNSVSRFPSNSQGPACPPSQEQRLEHGPCGRRRWPSVGRRPGTLQRDLPRRAGALGSEPAAWVPVGPRLWASGPVREHRDGARAHAWGWALAAWCAPWLGGWLGHQLGNKYPERGLLCLCSQLL